MDWPVAPLTLSLCGSYASQSSINWAGLSSIDVYALYYSPQQRAMHLWPLAAVLSSPQKMGAQLREAFCCFPDCIKMEMVICFALCASPMIAVPAY